MGDFKSDEGPSDPFGIGSYNLENITFDLLKRSVSSRKAAGLYKLDTLIETVVYLICACSVWSFGAVDDSSELFLSVCMAFTACLLAFRHSLARKHGVETRWDANGGSAYFWAVRLLIVTNILLLLYVLLHWINYRAEFDLSSLTFEYREGFLVWLPHSYDRTGTAAEFWRMLAMSAWFWALRDWLLTIDRGDLRSDGFGAKMSVRLNRLVVFLCMNAIAVGIVGILQRLGTNETLLWLRVPLFPNPDSHFGPFAYRGNACSYFNLVWPLFGLMLLARVGTSGKRRARVGGDPRIALFPGLVMLIGIPFFSASRAGSIVAFLCIALSLVLLRRFVVRKNLLSIVLVSIIAFVIAFLGVGDLLLRINMSLSSNYAVRGLDRILIYENAYSMLREYSPWGSGPGSFASMYHMYRSPRIADNRNNRLEPWNAWVHSDPLEYLVTYGFLGTVLLLVCLLLVFFIPVLVNGWRVVGTLLGFVYISGLGFCVHSIVDFPFQVFGLACNFVVVMAIASAAGFSPVLVGDREGQERRFEHRDRFRRQA